MPKYPTPPASCSTTTSDTPSASPQLPQQPVTVASTTIPSATGSTGQKKLGRDTPLDLSTKASPTPSPSNSPPPLVINSDPDGAGTEASDDEDEEDEDEEGDEEEDEEMEVTIPSTFTVSWLQLSATM